MKVMPGNAIHNTLNAVYEIRFSGSNEDDGSAYINLLAVVVYEKPDLPGNCPHHLRGNF